MKKIDENVLQSNDYILFIHTSFCGTCQLAQNMLLQIEGIHKETIFYEMNASLYPEFMQEYQVESVPCLFIKNQGMVKEKIYVFHSISNIYSYLINYKPELFQK